MLDNTILGHFSIKYILFGPCHLLQISLMKLRQQEVQLVTEILINYLHCIRAYEYLLVPVTGSRDGAAIGLCCNVLENTYQKLEVFAAPLTNEFVTPVVITHFHRSGCIVLIDPVFNSLN